MVFENHLKFVPPIESQQTRHITFKPVSRTNIFANRPLRKPTLFYAKNPITSGVLHETRGFLYQVYTEFFVAKRKLFSTREHEEFLSEKKLEKIKPTVARGSQYVFLRKNKGA